jgi:transcriptional regulator with XRE-family HTH domain
MEFHEKIRELRKHKGITQDELAEALFVSRTAISKWESGRGFPNIDSLKALAKFYSISLDDLLSSEEVLAIVEDDHKLRQQRTCDLVLGLLDCSFLLLLVLPLFGQKVGDGIIQHVAMTELTATHWLLRGLYVLFAVAIPLYGVLTLVLQTCQVGRWLKMKSATSLALGLAAVCIFITSRQAYAALISVALLLVKSLVFIKKR